jgi:hypothetical protein
VHEAGQDRTADADPLGLGTDVHPLDLSGRLVDRLERAHADRRLIKASHE